MLAWWWRAFVALSLVGGTFCAAAGTAFFLQRVTKMQWLQPRAWVMAGRAALVLALLSVVPWPGKTRLPTPLSMALPAVISRIETEAAKVETRVRETRAAKAPPRSFLEPTIVVVTLGALFFSLLSIASLWRKQRRWRVVHRLGHASVRESTAPPFAYRTLFFAEVVAPEKTPRMVLRHEFAHHRHGDTLWALPLALLRSVFFANPIVHAFLWWLRELEEIAADEAAARGATKTYSRALIAAGWQALGTQRHVHAAQTSLERRIRFMAARANGLRKISVMILVLAMTSAGAQPQLRPLSLQDVLSAYWTGDENQLYGSSMEDSWYYPRAHHAFDIRIGGQTVASLNHFRADPKWRAYVQNGIHALDADNLSPLFQRKLAEYQLPRAALAIAVLESGVRNLPASENPFHCAGVWQFIPATAKKFGMHVDQNEDDRMNIDLETDAAMRYLAALQLRFKDYRLAIMAYNQGEDRVQDAIDETSSRDPDVLIEKSGLNHYLYDVEAVELVMAAPVLLEQ